MERQQLVEFVNSLEARGVKLVLRRNRLNAGKQQKLLTANERTFINTHRAALKEIIQDPQRVQSKSMAAAVAEPEPEPVVWTHNYVRVRPHHLAAANVPPGLPKREAYELAKRWLDEQDRKRADEWYSQSLRHAARGGRDEGSDQRMNWEVYGYD